MPDSQHCEVCGAALSVDAPANVCSPCLLRHALETGKTPAPVAPETIQLTFHVKVQPGDKIGRYKLLQQIGEGGCGVVYMAEQEEPVKRRVALKVIKPGMDTREVLGRFEAERQALALMDHPNICKVLDAGATETGRPFFVMELVRGIPITRYCDENKLKTEQRLELFIQVCQAIQHAHQKGIIHRDIKPSNILVADQGGKPAPQVIDFGIAKATAGQKLTDKTIFTALEQFIGTPAYMSPEQANLSGLDIDTRSDIYSLGVLLYELLTGKTPFEAKRLLEAGFDEIRRIIREEEPPCPSQKLSTLAAAEQTTMARARQTDSPRLINLIRGDLDWIVMKCLEKDRNRRYETANGLAYDIMRHVKNEPVVARPPSQLYRFKKLVRRNKLAFAAASAVLAALVIGLGVSIWSLRNERQAHQLALSAERTAVAESKKAKSEAERAKAAETLATQRLAESEAISTFLTELFESPDPARKGHTVTVAETLGAATKKLETELTNQPALRAKLQATLGSTYFALGLYGEAIPLRERVRDYYMATSGPQHANTLAAMGDLAISYAEAGRLEEALKLREDVLTQSRKVLGPENPGTLIAMQNLANSYDDHGRQDEALRLREEVLALKRKVLGPEKSGTLVAMRTLAMSYAQAGHPDEALKLFEEVLALYRKVLGPEHPNTLRAMNDLAVTYHQAGRRDEALKLKEQVLALKRKLLPPEHPDTLVAMNNLANSYDEAGHRDEALKLREEVLALRRKVLGSEHPSTLNAMMNLEASYNAAGLRDEALRLGKETFALCRKVLRPEHPYTLVAMSTLAEAYERAGHPDDALKLREEVLTSSLKVVGPESPNTLDATESLATSYDEAGRRDEALKLRKQVLALRRKVLGAEHPDTLWAAQCLANSYDAAGRNSEANAVLEKACEVSAKDTDAVLMLATWQTWFGQDAHYEATGRHLVEQSEGTDKAMTAERAAMAYCLRPSTNAALLTNALELGRRAVELGKSDARLPRCQLALGLAQFRNGQYADAEKTLAAAEQTNGDYDDLPATAGLFRAMSLFRQNRMEEARKLFSRAERLMPPLPYDESKPFVDGKPLSHNALIGWLAYKEAKSVLNEPAASKP